MENLEKIREALMEAIAETNEEYMDRYFSGEEFTYDEIRYRTSYECALPATSCPYWSAPVSTATAANASRDSGYVLSAAPMRTLCPGTNPKTGEGFTADYNDQKPFSARVYKSSG